MSKNKNSIGNNKVFIINYIFIEHFAFNYENFTKGFLVHIILKIILLLGIQQCIFLHIFVVIVRRRRD